MKNVLAGIVAGAMLAVGAAGVADYDPAMAVAGSIVDADGVRWIDGTKLPLEGKAFGDVADYYDRLPANVTTNVNAGVRSMKHHSAGMCFRFRTDSRRLKFKWTPYDKNWWYMDHMPASGMSGIDVYRRNAAEGWRYVKTGRIHSPEGGVLEIDWRPGDECQVNLPLYNGIRAFSLGIDSAAKVEAPAAHRGAAKPVVFYGTSITHGGCASRPGNAFVSIIGRELDVPVVNLGFSGSGVMELEMSEHLARIDASCYVLDCLPNMYTRRHPDLRKGREHRFVEENYEPFIRNLRAKRPEVPIVMAEGPHPGHVGSADRDRVMKGVYDKLVSEGWKKLFYLPSKDMLPADGDGTVDDAHPNDYGMKQMAKTYGAAVRKALAAAPSLQERIARDHKIRGMDNWYGCRRTVFDFEGYEAWVVEPKEGVRPAKGNPWTWTMQWATAYVPRTSVPRLVNDLGWRHATIITFKDKMNQHGLEVSKRFQDYLVNSLGFAPKANLIGMSWGGFYSIRYAVAYPEAVNRVYLDCPLMCFGKPFNYGPWEAERPAGGDWSKHPGMPINLTAQLAATRIPVLLLYGGQDSTLPPQEQAEAFIDRFTAAGGNLRFTKRPMYGHHPHGVEETENTIIDFFCGSTKDGALEAAFERLAATVHGGERTATFLHRGRQEERSYLRKVAPCAVCEFTLRPSPESEIHAKLLMPPPERWNGRFWGIGNTGLGNGISDGQIREYAMPRFNEGSAVCLADMGTANGRHGAEVVKDFGWRAAHLMTVEAKKLIAEFYGRPARWSYFFGVSSGGGQGLHEATRFPEDYDGIVSYVPAHYRTWLVRHGRELNRGRELPANRRPFMHKVLFGAGSADEYSMDDAAFEKFIAAIRGDVDIPDENLSAFAARGGKLIVVSGLSDVLVDPATAERLAEKVVEKAGGKTAADRFFRLYQLPGRGHTQAAGVGGVEDIPATQAVEAWVEKAMAPGALSGVLKGGGEKPVKPW
ncbi:MAG: alpha/beta fold hydrolase [Kiritimatiellae bacterium]|nr:alpha/beta fold hydrolase [Kiritimatiellia bacterium]